MNKTFILVGQILSIITTCYVAFYTLLFGLLGAFYEFNYLPTIILGIITLTIIAVIQLQRYKDGKTTKENANIWGVVLVFTGGLGGILALIGINQKSNNVGAPIELELERLNTLYERGMITKDEYQERRRKILDNIM